MVQVQRIRVRPLGRMARIGDTLMVPIMYLLSGTFRETPQQTHRWNNVKLARGKVKHLHPALMAHCTGTELKGVRSWLSIPFFHIPLLGGWKRYVVLAPSGPTRMWHVGWVAGRAAGVSRIELSGPARMLIGPGDVSFFGIDCGRQIPIQEVGRGRIGDGGPYAQVPLL